MKIRLYENKYKLELQCLLCDYYKETNGDDYIGSLESASVMIDGLLTRNYFIYLAIDKGKVIGFTLLYINNQYGMTKSYIVVDHMYVLPSYRSGRAVLWLYTTIGKVMTDFGVDGVGTTLIGSSNKANNTYVSGKVIAEVTVVKLSDIRDTYKRYMKSLKAT